MVDMEIRNVIVLSKGQDIPILESLEKRRVHYDRVQGYLASPDDFEGRDLVITFGGDGTVLDASKNILDEVPVLAVKSSDESVGALCQADADDFEHVIDSILDGSYVTEKWSRVEGSLGEESGTALNEIFAGPRYSSGPGRYVLSLNQLREEQRGSGIVVSTGTGSGGWYRNIPGSFGAFPRTSGKLRFIARDCGSDHGYSLMRGVLERGDELEIESMIKFDGTVDFDGYNRKAIDFPRGSVLSVRLSENPLTMIIPEKNYK